MIVLDTHAWLWLVTAPGRMSGTAMELLRRDRSAAVAAMSCWELAMLAAQGRISLDRDPVTWMEDSFSAHGLQLLPLTPAVAVASAQLKAFHRDPADRLIVATALVHGATLISKDERVGASGVVKVVW